MTRTTFERRELLAATATGLTLASLPTAVSGQSASGETVYVGGEDGAVYAVDTDGDEQWSFETEGRIISSPTVAAGRVYVGSEDGHLYALDASDGTEVWSFETGLSVWSSPTVIEETIYVGGLDGYLYAVDATDGTERWSLETSDRIVSSPSVVDETVLVGSEDGHVYAVDAIDGSEYWSFDTGSYVRSSPTVVDETVYVASYDGHLYALDLVEGTERWSFETDDVIGASPTVMDGVVFIGSEDGAVYAVDAADGTETWTFDTDDRVWSSPTVADGIVYVGSFDNHLYALDATDGTERWSYETADFVFSSPTVVQDTVYVGSGDGRLYALHTSTGSEDWTFGTDRAITSSPTMVGDPAGGYSVGSRTSLGTLGHHGEGRYSDGGPWEHIGVEAELTAIETSIPVISPGDSQPITISIANTGATHTFFVAIAMITPDGRLLDQHGTTAATVSVEAGQVGEVEIPWSAPQTAPSGEYDIIGAIWAERDREHLETKLDTRTNETVFELSDGVRPPGSRLRESVSPTEWPDTDTQSIEVGELVGTGVECGIDREEGESDRVRVTASIGKSATDSVITTLDGRDRSQLFVIYDQDHLSPVADESTVRVDDGAPKTISLSAVQGSLSGPSDTVGEEYVQNAVAELSASLGEQWSTADIDYQPPWDGTESVTAGILHLDFDTEYEDLFVESFEQYEIELVFERTASFDSSSMSIIPDIRGETTALTTGSVLTRTGPLPVEYRSHVVVQVDDGQVDDSTADGLPGFGITTALASLGGMGYLVKRRLGAMGHEE